MKQAVIDIGSNSVRLTLYRIIEQGFKIIFREKIMAGLAGYVENSALSLEGIKCACDALNEFRHTLEFLDIQNVYVFATASLRNISNTEQAIQEIEKTTGFTVEVISGQQEAMLGYSGAMQVFHISDGAFVDIGGASSEVVIFENGNIQKSMSFGVGSLSLYRRCVKNIVPGSGSMKRIENVLENEMVLPKEKYTSLIGVGGTVRGVLKLAKKVFHLPDDCHRISATQFEQLSDFLFQGDKSAIDLILKTEPERIHTIIPGCMILKYLFDYFNAEELIVSKYGVREGYLCQKIQTNNIAIPKTEN
ncbi:MAG: hypothetical protein ACI4UK_11485 [Floccifex sp.]